MKIIQLVITQNKQKLSDYNENKNLDTEYILNSRPMHDIHKDLTMKPR